MWMSNLTAGDGEAELQGWDVRDLADPALVGQVPGFRPTVAHRGDRVLVAAEGTRVRRWGYAGLLDRG